ncbi:hypothetical protein K435DRAFT_866987 [Dendrothele bispora CBS 962.96]|uniref:Uncharacterized protein n=1 Tax=Dendrothele bispora (strain CBS 962.96) TaxID=1314807 RepID=A0A4S8LGS0_DENBC|nr:hypothetical protein K435DRAFT_866987 [Dendrothele bispora CBS 962.96]
MLQKYLLRLIILGPYHGYTTFGGIRLEEKVENPSDDFEQLIHDSYEFISFDRMEDRAKKAKMLIHFRWLCRKRSSVMYRCYMPVFVEIASGSRHYPDIIAAIEKATLHQQGTMPPIMDIDSSNVNSPIEILEIPENLKIDDSRRRRRNSFIRPDLEDKSIYMEDGDESMDTEEKEEKEDAEAAQRNDQEVSNAGV